MDKYAEILRALGRIEGELGGDPQVIRARQEARSPAVLAQGWMSGTHGNVGNSSRRGGVTLCAFCQPSPERGNYVPWRLLKLSIARFFSAVFRSF